MLGEKYKQIEINKPIMCESSLINLIWLYKIQFTFSQQVIDLNNILNQKRMKGNFTK